MGRSIQLLLRLRWHVVALLVAVVMVFAVIRLSVDVPNLVAGRTPESGSFHDRYAEHPWIAYLHILPGVGYLTIAPLQLNRSFRARHLTLHRRLGRTALVLGLTSGVLAMVFGLLFPFGGVREAVAVAVFGAWFVACLSRAFLAIRRRDVAAHRRWMIRGFAVALGVGTQRVVLGLLMLSGEVAFASAFGVAFWLSWVPHALVAETYLRLRKAPMAAPALHERLRT